ncbi:hypothetical protein CK203_053333 [Vitis vinifera]|uniref:Uncharacterized protein n=1 Tax=Vitis vinifera TaxID=29760 RepID=A0A438GW87_VITVI|nr:hypothetical protein CK203_053333 [Vitis vinifera]
MGDFSQSVDVEKLISYSDDLVECLRGKRDIDSLTQCLEHSSALQSSCDADFGEVQSLVQACQENVCFIDWSIVGAFMDWRDGCISNSK